ncbi:hypothetical protein IC229_31370 [Spirosoma sp. BT702]|uniref:DUF6965 domain-containing protein n=1 Tax=Spirosoma profusum TaxID=2771354 RepID=A0A927AVH6_9BACT|nr:hypothetical protein [Spirosoma profusum]MBD2705164.1 hypothetical protein [Spirosoma profusum]
MHLRSEHQALVDYFADRNLPTGPQHINEYSIFFNLPAAVNSRLTQLHSDVEATRNSAALMLEEVKNWLTTNELT